jgi:hypothetical protein
MKVLILINLLLIIFIECKKREDLLQFLQDESNNDVETMMKIMMPIMSKRFPKWYGSSNKLKSRFNLFKNNQNYGDMKELRKIWEKTMKTKNNIYEKNNLLL